MPDDGQVVAAGAVRGGGDEFGQRGQRAQSLAAPQRLDGGGGVVAQARGALVVAALGERADLMHRRAQCAVVQPVDQGRGARHGRRVLGGRHVAGGRAGRHLKLGAGRPVQRRTRQPRRAGSDAGEAGQQGRRIGGVGARPERADGAVVSGRPHHRQPWKRLVGQHDPPPTLRESSTGGCTAAHVRPASAARALRPRADGRIRRGRLRWPAPPSPSSGARGSVPLKYWLDPTP